MTSAKTVRMAARARPLPLANLAVSLMTYWGICFCSPHCARGQTHAHGPAYRAYSAACYALAATLTLFSLLTLCFDCGSFQELTDGFINFCSLYTTWVYIRVWRTKAVDVHLMLVDHYRFLDGLGRRANGSQRLLLARMYRVEALFTVYMFASLGVVIAAVMLQAVWTLVPALPPVPRALYAAPAPERFAVIAVLQGLALPCCGMPFAGLTAVHVGLNIHAMFLLQYLKCEVRTLDDVVRLPGHAEGRLRRQREAVDGVIQQHQHIVRLIRSNNEIFSGVMMQRGILTYALLGLTAFCLSKDPFGDVKIPIITAFMILSLLQFAVLSDLLKDQCAAVNRWLWLSDWLRAHTSSWGALSIVMARAQRSDRDGLMVKGMQDRVSMMTFVQVVRSSVSFLQALRNINTS